MHDIDTIGHEAEFEAEFETESGVPLSEAEEELLAAELLGVTSEEELEQFLGKIFKRAKRGFRRLKRKVRKFARPLARTLKGVAQAALPAVGAALGSAVPGLGTALGGSLGSMLSKALGSFGGGGGAIQAVAGAGGAPDIGSLLSGLLTRALSGQREVGNHEEIEFETARRFVRLADRSFRESLRVPENMSAKRSTVRALRCGARHVLADRFRRRGFKAIRRQRPVRQEFDEFEELESDELFMSESSDLPASQEAFEQEHDGEFETEELFDELESYENEMEWEGIPEDSGQPNGRWVRRGNKIVLMGA